MQRYFLISLVFSFFSVQAEPERFYKPALERSQYLLQEIDHTSLEMYPGDEVQETAFPVEVVRRERSFCPEWACKIMCACVPVITCMSLIGGIYTVLEANSE